MKLRSGLKPHTGAAVRRVTVALSLFASVPLLVSCLGNGGLEPMLGRIPLNAVFDVEIVGFATIDGAETGISWVRSGNLALTRTLTSAGATGNGVNSVEAALVTTMKPVDTEPGGLYVGTHTGLRTLVESGLPAPTYDIAFVVVDPTAGVVDVSLDQAMLAVIGSAELVFNRYRIGTTDTAKVNVVQNGAMTLTVSADGNSVDGEFLIVGSPEDEMPSQKYGYRGTFVGTRRR